MCSAASRSPCVRRSAISPSRARCRTSEVPHRMSRDFQPPGRSPVIACEGMAATSHPLATLAAIDALRDGGTAADAAVAAVAALCVIEAESTGIGGDCYCLVSQPGKPVWGYNGSGRSGATASDQALRAKGMEAIGMTSVHADRFHARSEEHTSELQSPYV